MSGCLGHLCAAVSVSDVAAAERRLHQASNKYYKVV